MEISARINKMDIIRMQFATFFKIHANLYAFIFIWLLAVIFGFSSLPKYGLVIFAVSPFIVAFAVFLAMFLAGVIFVTAISNEERGFIGEHKFAISDEGFSEESSGTSTFTRWNGVKYLTKSSSALYLKISGYRIHIIPRRAFSNKDDFESFSNEILSKIKAA